MLLTVLSALLSVFQHLPHFLCFSLARNIEAILEAHLVGSELEFCFIKTTLLQESNQ